MDWLRLLDFIKPYNLQAQQLLSNCSQIMSTLCKPELENGPGLLSPSLWVQI